MSIRLPRQAGQFYSNSEAILKQEIEKCFINSLGPGEIPHLVNKPLSNLVALVVPHAGYMFSGPVAAHGFALAAASGIPDSVIILGPNHTGLGSGISIVTRGTWRTPLGDVKVDTDLANSIQSSSRLIDIDDRAHLYEHSVEVQLPFLQYIYGPNLRFVPICMMLQDLISSRDVGEAIAKSSRGKNTLIVASTDLSHYQPQKIAEELDKKAIEAILRLDEIGLQNAVETYGLSMCGYGPTSAAIIASKGLGAAQSKHLSYHTSGDITGDRSSVVGYCSIAITRN
jgi:AmmeMemoRadiSam system protein B